MPRPTRLRMRAVAAAGALTVLLILTGCGGGSAKPQQPGTSSGPSADPGSDQTDDRAALDPGAGAPQIGQCFRMTGVQSRASVAAPARVGCDKPHTSVVAFVGYVEKPISPLTPVAQRRAVGQKVCEPAYRRVVGGTLADRAQSLLTWTLFTPSQQQLVAGARWVRCDVLARSGEELVPLPRETPMLGNGVSDALRICQSAGGAEVSCARPHVFRVTAVFAAPGRSYPGVTSAQARQRCQELTGVPGGFFQPPSSTGWKAGDRFVRCLIQPRATNPTLRPSPTP